MGMAELEMNSMYKCDNVQICQLKVVGSWQFISGMFDC